jgi:L-aspartate oxidase
VSVSVPEAWKVLRGVCTEALGIERDGARLSLVAGALEEFALLPLSQDRAALELRAGAITARLMARAASLRRESRGVHYRTDFPQPDPLWAGIRLRLARS